mgnify:CR=1 FL=1
MPIHPAKKSPHHTDADIISSGQLAGMQLALGKPAPKRHFPLSPIDADVAAQVIRDELLLDGNARLNLATFVTTEMEPQVTQLMAEAFDKNMIDKDEYPQTAEIEARCVKRLSHLWNSPSHERATGTSTTGSSEAVMLGGRALKWKWR